MLRQREHGVEMVQLRWGFPPDRPKGAPSSTSAPRVTLSEWSLPNPGFPLLRVHRHEAAEIEAEKAREDWFCFAGLWRPMADGGGDAFTLLTTEPGPTWHRSTIDRWLYSTAQIGWPGST